MSLDSQSNNKRLLSKAMLASNATCLDYADIQSDVSLAVWCNQKDRVLTHNKDLHTLSMYIEGGQGTYRTDLKNRDGAPNKLCFFPADHASDWVVGNPLKLVHFYFTDTHLNYLGLTAFDKDPRTLELPDLTFESDPVLVKSIYSLLNSLDSSDFSNRLQLQEMQQTIILHLLENYSSHSQEIVRGGLSPRTKARILDYMQTHIDQDITLEQLANEACMSTYHFAHMFKQSVGLSPYQFLLKQRMALASSELQSGHAIGKTGAMCGYSTPSRFARAFKNFYGVTPTLYKQAVA